MEWFIAIIIIIGASLLFGFAAREKNEKFSWLFFFIILAISLFLVMFMPLLIAILCAAAVFIYEEKKPNYGNSIWHAFIAFIIVGMILVGLYFEIPSATKVVETNNISLVSLRTSVASSGDMFLGFGSIDGTFYYAYSYMQGREFMQGLIAKTPSVHVYPDRTDGKGYIITYKSTFFRDTSSWPINLVFNGVPEETGGSYWTEITVPPDSIIQGLKI